MPELPEVETIRLKIEPLVINKRIQRITGPDHTQIDSQKYLNTIDAHDRLILALRRRGKYLIFVLENDKELIVHLAMTGGWRTEATSHTRLVIHLEDKALYFHDPRRFGKVAVVDTGDYALFPTLQQMGPEPLSGDFQLDVFIQQAACASRVKPWLLSQKPVSGIGNIYADEVLWQAKIHPLQTQLQEPQAIKLYGAIRQTMQQAVTAGGSSLGKGQGNYRQHDGESGSYQDQHQVYGRTAKPCSRCGNSIMKINVAGRGTHFCPVCQVLQ